MQLERILRLSLLGDDEAELRSLTSWASASPEEADVWSPA